MSSPAEIAATCEVICGRNPTHASKIRELANIAIRDDLDVRDFNKSVLDQVLRSEPLHPIRQRSAGASIGLNRRDVKAYSIGRLVRGLIEGRIDGIEKECSDEVARALGRQPAGAFLPDEIVQGAHRTLLALSSADGGYTVGEELLDSQTVELQRNQSHIVGLGAQVLPGLVGNVSIPRQLTGATVYWVNETGAITQSSATFGQIVARPRRIGASVPFSKEFLAQTSLGAEAFIVADMTAAINVELDRVALRGNGGSEPLGIVNLASGDRSTSVSFGAAPSYAKYLEFMSNVETNNALVARAGFITSPASKYKAMQIARISASGSLPIWANDSDVCGKPGRSTNQVANNLVVFGDFSQVLFCEWAGWDVVVDPYTSKREGVVEITIQRLIDVIIRRGKSFAISTDSGAQ